MESIFALLSSHFTSATQSNTAVFKTNLRNRLDLLKFCFPFEVFPMKKKGDEKKGTSKKKALIFDLSVRQTWSQKQSFSIFALVGDICCFDAPSLLKIWNIDECSEPLREIGCVFSRPYATSSGSCTMSLMEFFCSDTFDFNFFPRMHIGAQEILKKRAHDISTIRPMFDAFMRIYRNPYTIQEDFPTDDAWRPKNINHPPNEEEFEENEPNFEDICWSRIGSLVYTLDYFNRMCVYVHPILMTELKTYSLDPPTDYHLNKYGCPWKSEDIFHVFWEGLEKIDRFKMSDENGWILMDHVLRKAINIPPFHVNHTQNLNTLGEIYANIYNLKKKVFSALQSDVWPNVFIVADEKFLSPKRLKNIMYEVCVISKKYFMRKHEEWNGEKTTNVGTLQITDCQEISNNLFGQETCEIIEPTTGGAPKASAILKLDGSMLVLAGAQMKEMESSVLPLAIKVLRKKLQKNKILVNDPCVDGLILTQNFLFRNFKQAAACILGSVSDVNRCWKIGPNLTPLSSYLQKVDC